MHTASPSSKPAVEITTHTEISIVIKGLKYVITQPDGEPMRLGIYRTRSAKAGVVDKEESFLVINNTQEVYTILYTLLWRGALPDTLEGMAAQMRVIRINPDKPAKFIKGDVSVELSYTVLEPGHGGCPEHRASKYFVFTKHDYYACGFTRSKRRTDLPGTDLSATPIGVPLHKIPAIYLLLTTTDDLPEGVVVV